MSGARFVDGPASHLTTGRDTEIGRMIRALAVRAREFDSFVFTGCLICMGGGAVGGALLAALHNERLFRLEEAKHRVGGKVGWVRHGLDGGLDVCKFAVHGVDQEDGFEPVSVDRPHLLHFGKQVVYFVDGGAHGGAGNETDLECLLQEKGLRERGGPGVHGVWD